MSDRLLKNLPEVSSITGSSWLHGTDGSDYDKKISAANVRAYMEADVRAYNADWQAYPQGFKNLTVKPNSSNPNTQTDIAADWIYVEDVKLTSVSETWDIDTAGAGGLSTDSDAKTAYTWYYIFVICDDDGSTVSTLAKGIDEDLNTAPSPTDEDTIMSITLPGSYTKKRLVSAVYLDSSSDIRDFSQYNIYYQHLESTSAGSSGVELLDDSSLPNTETDLEIYKFLPLFSNTFTVTANIFDGSSNGTIYCDLYNHINGENQSYRVRLKADEDASGDSQIITQSEIITDDREIGYSANSDFDTLKIYMQTFYLEI